MSRDVTVPRDRRRAVVTAVDQHTDYCMQYCSTYCMQGLRQCVIDTSLGISYSAIMTNEFDDPQLRAWQDQADAGHFPTLAAAEWYARVQEMRQRADYYERGLIRYLKYDLGLTWQQVAEVVNANLNSRQAAQAKWKRLLKEDTRQYGGPGRGGWPRGRKRSD